MSKYVCFVGHTHELELVCYDHKHISRVNITKGRVSLNPKFKYIVNSGAVGQPRDVNNNAKYVIMDTAANFIDVRFIPYNVSKVVQKMKINGFPDYHANRLW
jgi:hypothetical protein